MPIAHNFSVTMSDNGTQGRGSQICILCDIRFRHGTLLLLKIKLGLGYLLGSFVAVLSCIVVTLLFSPS